MWFGIFVQVKVKAVSRIFTWFRSALLCAVSGAVVDRRLLAAVPSIYATRWHIALHAIAHFSPAINIKKGVVNVVVDPTSGRRCSWVAVVWCVHQWCWYNIKLQTLTPTYVLHCVCYVCILSLSPPPPSPPPVPPPSLSSSFDFMYKCVVYRACCIRVSPKTVYNIPLLFVRRFNANLLSR